MHQRLHIVRLPAPVKRPSQRQAKVIVLEARRTARLQAARHERQPPRDAA